MARLRINNCGDPTGATNPITLSSPTTTTVHWASSPGFQTLTGSDYYVIISEPGTENEEIIYLVAPYTAGATSGTVLREQEGTTGVAHVATPWVHGPTQADFGPGGIPANTYDAYGAAATAAAAAQTAAEAFATSAISTAVGTETTRAEAAEAALASEIAGISGGGGGPSNVLLIRKFPIAYNTAGILNGATLYTPASGDVVYDIWFQTDTAWNGLTPQADVGTFSGGGSGRGLAAALTNGAMAFDMTKADADFFLRDNTGIKIAFNNTRTLSGLLQNFANVNAASPLGAPFIFDGTNPLKVVISQDGTNQSSPASATLTAQNAPTSPLTVTNPSEYQFTWVGSPNGSAAPETFSMSGGTYTGATAIAAAMAAATGSVSGEAFSTKCTVTVSGGKIVLTAATPGAAANGNAIEAANGDVSQALGFVSPSTLNGGTGGDPGSTAGSGVIYVLTGTPA